MYLMFMLSAHLVFFQAMKGEKGMPGVAVAESLGDDLTDDGFSKLTSQVYSVYFRILFSICFVPWSQSLCFT